VTALASADAALDLADAAPDSAELTANPADNALDLAELTADSADNGNVCAERALVFTNGAAGLAEAATGPANGILHAACQEMLKKTEKFYVSHNKHHRGDVI